jgi:hypothetical protein
MIVTEMKNDESIMQDFLLGDGSIHVSTGTPVGVINEVVEIDGIEDTAATQYGAYYVITEGRQVVLGGWNLENNIPNDGAELAVSGSADRYELRIRSNQLRAVLEDGHVYVLQVYEYNTTNGYRQCIHEEKIKVKF